MNIKTKVITLIIASILVIPAIVNPSRDGGEVLGISESSSGQVNEAPAVENSTNSPAQSNGVVNTQETSVGEDEDDSGFKITNPFKGLFGGDDDPKPAKRPIQIKDISSGIRDVEEIKSNDRSVPKQKVGKVKWEDSTDVHVISDIYPVGSGVQVTAGNKTTNLVINKSRVLVPGTLLVVDQETFIELGGNPELQTSLDVEIIYN